jgi:hypothetical protein
LKLTVECQWRSLFRLLVFDRMRGGTWRLSKSASWAAKVKEQAW